jgi:hypothetical protein
VTAAALALLLVASPVVVNTSGTPDTRVVAAMTADTNTRKRKRRELGSPTVVYSRQEFCDAHRISRSYYYKLRELGRGPVETHISENKVVITAEDAAKWRKQRRANAPTSALPIAAQHAG